MTTSSPLTGHPSNLALVLALCLATLALSARPADAQGEWSAGPRHPVPRDHHATFVLDRGEAPPRLCVAGGNTYSSIVADVWCAFVGRDGALADWQPEPAMPYGVAGSGLVVTDDLVVLVSGRDADFENTARVLVGHPDPANQLDLWLEAAPFPAPVFHLTAERVGDWIYAVGGTTGTDAVDAVWRARLGPGGPQAWEPARDLPDPRSHHASFVHDGSIYVTGGMSGSPTGDVLDRRDVIRAEVLPDGSLSPWTVVSETDSTRLAHAAFAHDGHAYLVGGIERATSPSDAVLRAPLLPGGGLGPWTPTVPLPLARGHVHHVPVLNGRAYSVGGRVGRRVSGQTHSRSL